MTCHEVWEEMNSLLSNPQTKFIRNYSRSIDMSPSTIAPNEGYTVETELFPVEALKVYSAYNLQDEIEEEQRKKYFSAHRGGSQGDYREGMKDKIANVVDCLRRFPSSKRAVITIPNTSKPNHESDDDAKCMREIHFYLDKDEGCTSTTTSGGSKMKMNLNATVWMRAQAAEIFPKNIHFVGSLMERVAEGIMSESISVEIGELFYLATTLVSVRED
eukprot:CAMPEP_0204618204 /NCGR_PEP_ID=MMETSP0717-20131115/4934_1 /ASSEMBLY_ACC=CAM_ASM_000666 /TAXON_ID=230516 /ORGANISM="Chaetoceros curvisetus" /LENGTH=216 /DNA_ID=CAMNT_0051631895 /DNA_START=10 /DNA_END=660 /DNA_ORIENTATION=-